VITAQAGVDWGNTFGWNQEGQAKPSRQKPELLNDVAEAAVQSN
jgi:hypothetical protein